MSHAVQLFFQILIPMQPSLDVCTNSLGEEWTIDACKCPSQACYIVARSKSGRKYSGTCLNNKFHGEGTLEFEDGKKYVGEFRSGMKSGKGKYQLPDGTTIESNFIADNLDGEAEIVYPNGDRFFGELSDTLPDGAGRIAKTNGESYNGNFVNGKYHGFGNLTVQNDRSYSGEFESGLFHGRGTLSTEAGYYYEGDWRSGVENGQGISKEKDITYRGEWKEGKKEGKFLVEEKLGKLVWYHFRSGELKRKENVKGPTGLVDVWDTTLTLDVDEVGREHVKLALHYDNKIPHKVVGVKVRVAIRNSFNKVVFQNTFEDEVMLLESSRSRSDTFWVYENNPYIRGEVYDNIWQIARNGTAKIDTKILKIVTDDGKVYQ